MRRARREAEAFSMSFLDCICCGFGAVILLLVVTEYGDPVPLAATKEDLQKAVAKSEQALFEIRGNSIILERELAKRVEAMKAEQAKLARLRGDLTAIEGQYKASENEEDAMKKLAETLATTRAAMIEEIKAGFPGHYIVFDAPPLLLTVDPLVLARQVDHVLLVVRANVTPRAAVMKAIESLGPDRLRGIVFNAAQPQLGHYYGYRDYYYGPAPTDNGSR